MALSRDVLPASIPHPSIRLVSVRQRVQWQQQAPHPDVQRSRPPAATSSPVCLRPPADMKPPRTPQDISVTRYKASRFRRRRCLIAWFRFSPPTRCVIVHRPLHHCSSPAPPPPPADPHPAARHVGDESLEVELYATNRFTLMSADRPSFYSKLFLNRFDTRLALRLTSVEAVDRIGKGPACINVTARFEAKRKKKTCSKKRQQTRFL